MGIYFPQICDTLLTTLLDRLDCIVSYLPLMYLSEKKLNLKQIADYLDGKIIGNEDCEVGNILPLDLANEDDISF